MNEHAFVSLEQIMNERENKELPLGTILPNTLFISKSKRADGFINININLNHAILETSLYVAAIDELLTARAEDHITIYLQTPGGNLFTGISIISAMERTKANLKVVANGICASCGALILFATNPDNIVVRDWASVMVHGPSTEMKGKVLDISNTSVNLIEWFECIYQQYVKQGLLTQDEYDKIMVKKLDVFIPVYELKNRLTNMLNTEGA